MLNYFIQIQGKRSLEKEKAVFSAGVHRKQRRFVRVHSVSPNGDGFLYCGVLVGVVFKIGCHISLDAALICIIMKLQYARMSEREVYYETKQRNQFCGQ